MSARLLRLFGLSILVVWTWQWRVSVEQISSPPGTYLGPSQLVTAVLVQGLMTQLLQATQHDGEYVAHLMGELPRPEDGRTAR